jgi:hypothetical protein
MKVIHDALTRNFSIAQTLLLYSEIGKHERDALKDASFTL